MPEINTIAQAQIDKIAEDCKRIKPLVAIQCITYNHEPYIRDALEGFVMQKTDFPFVAIVHDDASTDGTAAIIREYAEKYPDIIKPIYEYENQYSKPDGSLGRVMYEAVLATGAKYVAICEGDDYWTSQIKLQKQSIFLEKHIEYSMCFHNVYTKNESTTELDKPQGIKKTQKVSLFEVLNKWIIPTCSAFMRMECLERCPRDNNFIVGDNVLWTSCFNLGDVIGFKDLMGVYRQNENGWMSRMAQKDDVLPKLEAWIKHYMALSKYCSPQNEEAINIILLNKITLYSLELTYRKKIPISILHSLKIIISKTFQYLIRHLKSCKKHITATN